MTDSFFGVSFMPTSDVCARKSADTNVKPCTFFCYHLCKALIVPNTGSIAH